MRNRLKQAPRSPSQLLQDVSEPSKELAVRLYVRCVLIHTVNPSAV